MANTINADNGVSSGSAGLKETADSSGVLALQTNGTTAVTVDTSQNVGIGTASPAAKLEVSTTTAATNFRFSGNNFAGGNFYGTSVNTSGVFLGLDSGGGFTTNVRDAGYQAFSTTNTERMRIDSSGNLLVGYTTSNGAYKLQVNSQIFATSAIIATSDGRYKKDIQSLDGALELVTQLNPVQFSWKQHPIHNFDTSFPTLGFIAQEVKQVLIDKPYLNSVIKVNQCVIEPEEKNNDGNITKEAVTEEFLGIAEGNMLALLTKAIQELATRVKALESK